MEHDQQDVVPGWFKEQPRSPAQVYGPETVKDIQRTLNVRETGEMDSSTVSHIMGLQQLFGIAPTGTITLETAVQIERLRSRYGDNDNI